MTPPQTSLMILRVWTEEGSTEPFRVDVRQSSDLSAGIDRTLTLTDLDRALGVVRTFLEASRSVDVASRSGVRRGG